MTTPSLRRCSALGTAVLLALGLMSGPAAAQPPDAQPPDAEPAEADSSAGGGPDGKDFDIEVLSGPADAATGGSALVEVTVPQTVPVHQVGITLDGHDVREEFAAAGDPRRLVGHLTELQEGDNTLRVEANGRGHGRPSAELGIVDHPAHGPVFSGPQVPMYCSADAAPWNLGEVDEYCHVDESQVSYRYRTQDGEFRDLAEDEDLPEDIATATTTEGEEVPYAVRIERGTLNRAVYETAILHEPGTALPDPWTETPGWNGVLAYTFGGACGTGHWQGASTGGVENDLLLGQGYAVASSSLNVYATNCDDVTSAETAMMVKEHFIESYGPDRFTVGWGGSAGTMQQLLISNSYPGIIDGVIGEIGYSDERTTGVNAHDCRQLTGYWDQTDQQWTDEQIMAVTGYATPGSCSGFLLFESVDLPGEGCHAAIPVEDRWHPEDNPDGVRCTIADLAANVYGTDDEGRGLRTIPDNVGVQYGLDALEQGVISAEQFVEMNESVGGIDVDGEPTAQRSEADPRALAAAYATGRVNQFTGGLEHTPIIEVRPYRDHLGDFHDRYRSWTMRERMLNAYGEADTHVSWTGSAEGTVPALMRSEALSAMHDWLDLRAELAAQEPEADARSLTAQARPADLSDGCYAQDEEWIAEELSYTADNACNELFPYHADPRVMAGGPTSGDVLKCTLSEPRREDYATSFTDEEWQRLQDAFPEGVCDWSQPGVGQVELDDVWLSFPRD